MGGTAKRAEFDLLGVVRLLRSVTASEAMGQKGAVWAEVQILKWKRSMKPGKSGPGRTGAHGSGPALTVLRTLARGPILGDKEARHSRRAPSRGRFLQSAGVWGFAKEGRRHVGPAWPEMRVGISTVRWRRRTPRLMISSELVARLDSGLFVQLRLRAAARTEMGIVAPEERARETRVKCIHHPRIRWRCLKQSMNSENAPIRSLILHYISRYGPNLL
jgi:hypothetical protein